MVVLTCVSLMASGVGHLFTCLLPIRVSSLENPDPILNLCLEGLGLQEAVPRWGEGHSIPSPPPPPPCPSSPRSFTRPGTYSHTDYSGSGWGRGAPPG